MLNSWLNMTMLAAESQRAIFLRMMRISLGGRAGAREAARILPEKAMAMTVAAAQVARGASPDTVVKGYRSKVKANIRRLSRAK